MKVTLLGTGSPIPDPHRAGPATLISVESDGVYESPSSTGEHFLIDAGRGVLMRLAAAGIGPPQLAAVLLTHLHSDHITDLGDVITTRWVMTFEPDPLIIVGPPGTEEMVANLLASLSIDVGYRIAHHTDLTYPPPVRTIEVSDGTVDLSSLSGVPISTTIGCAPTDHRPVEPTVAYRFEEANKPGRSVVVAGDTIPCAGLDRLATDADVLVHTVIRKDIIATVPIQRLRDTLDYHSSPAEAAATASRAQVGTLMMTHYVPAPPPGEEHEWQTLAAAEFDGAIIVGPDLTSLAVQER